MSSNYPLLFSTVGYHVWHAKLVQVSREVVCNCPDEKVWGDAVKEILAPNPKCYVVRISVAGHRFRSCLRRLWQRAFWCYRGESCTSIVSRQEVLQVFLGLSNRYRHNKIHFSDFFSISYFIDRNRDGSEEVLMNCSANCLCLTRNIVYWNVSTYVQVSLVR